MEHGMIPRDSIKIIGESVGSNIGDDVSLALANDVEYRIREILQVTESLASHCTLLTLYRRPLSL